MSENQERKPQFNDYFKAFLAYLRRPKTVFDIKDRTKGIIFFGSLIILLHKVVEILSD